MKRPIALVPSTLAAALLGSQVALAQAPNIDNLKQMKVSGVDPRMPPTAGWLRTSG